jgi:hypothetical protein
VPCWPQSEALVSFAVVTVWDELRPLLLDLEDTGCLLVWPNPRDDEGEKPPFGIDLETWGVDFAEELHRRFGDAVQLQVGAMTFPDRSIVVPRSVEFQPSILIEPDDITVNLEGPHEVPSGRTVDTGLRLHNHTDAEIDIHTQEEWTETRLVDLRTGDVVGGYRGYIPRPAISHLKIVQLPPHGSVLVPLRVGTASTVPELGYAVPPGEWGLVAYLWLGPDEHVRTPPLPFTVSV